MDFAGEKVPLDIYYVRESLEREIIANTYMHSSSIMMFKRAYRWFPQIEPILKKNNIPDDFKYLALAESNLTNAVSPAGAEGFWQFIKPTGKKYGLEITEEVDERYNVEKATQAACLYFQEAYELYKNWTLVAASFNRGFGGLFLLFVILYMGLRPISSEYFGDMDCNLQTIGVIAHGLNQVYPKVHKKYVAKMEGNGGFLTEYWSTSNPEKENFVKRNRIVAGMSEATIVIESAEKGGSLITANFANDYNRDVFAVPGRTSDKFSQGCNNLIKTQRANLLTSAADLIYILNWELHHKEEKVIQKQLFISLDNEEQKIHDYLQKKGKEELDTIALECGFPVFRISSILVNMELKGVIRPLPGKLFEVI